MRKLENYLLKYKILSLNFYSLLTVLGRKASPADIEKILGLLPRNSRKSSPSLTARLSMSLSSKVVKN